MSVDGATHVRAVAEIPVQQVEAAAIVLASELEHSCPTRMDGEDGWRAIAERALQAADALNASPGGAAPTDASGRHAHHPATASR